MWELAWWLHAMPEAGARIRASYESTDARFDIRSRFAHVVMAWHDAERAMRRGDAGKLEQALVCVRTRLR